MSKLSLLSQVGSLTYNFRRWKKNQVSIKCKLSQMKNAILIPCAIL